MRATYDAAANDSSSLRDWEHVDSLSVNAADAPEVLAILRRRGRHEMLNNPFMDGMLQTLSGDEIGEAPRLRMMVTSAQGPQVAKNAALNTLIEQEFALWMSAIRLPAKLQLSIETAAAQGEIFGRIFSNPKLATPVKIDLRLYEGDQIATPDFFARRTSEDTDGIIYDRWGNPAFYLILLSHPGDNGFLSYSGSKEAERVPAADVLHLFKVRRPGQRRGLPRIMSSMSLFPQRRAFRRSTLAASAAAAQLGAVVLETNAEPDSNDYTNSERDDPDIEPGTEWELSHGMMTTLPHGMKAHQMRPEQPGTGYQEFDTALITESGRPLGMPRNISTGDSSSYNFASGRLDHQTYDRAIRIDRRDITDAMLDPILRRWIEAAVSLPGYLPRRAKALLTRLPHKWLWQRRPHVDPAKEANAQSTRLGNTSTTVTRELANDGIDFEEHLSQLVDEVAAYKAAGLIHPSAAQIQAVQPTRDDEDLAERVAEINRSGNGRLLRR